ncbi:MAG: carbohydrate kinase family protein [Bacteroidetes bacterium]|nr:carbohydrate kinase family protein [Bacteroidota bacterium]
MKQQPIIKQAAEKLQKSEKSMHCLVGFDGFVDEIIHVVDKRKNLTEHERVPDIKTFAEKIASLAGLSGNLELVPIQTKLGGNGPIMANALIAQNHNVTYIGALGKHYVHPVFREFADSCKQVVSLTDPGFTEALEFFDGKLMMGKMNNLPEVSYDHLIEKLPEPELKKIMSDISLIGFTNWTMLYSLNSIIEKFSSIIAEQKNKPLVFIDLADPEKRTTEDIKGVLNLISKIPTKTILSMNQNESSIISNVLGIKEEELQKRASKIREKINVFGIVIHPTNGAAIACENETAWVDGPYTPKPKLTTGAGDNFNAGFCNAWMNGLGPAECLAAGVSSSGFYVRNARSVNRMELINFMKNWAEGKVGE